MFLASSPSFLSSFVLRAPASIPRPSIPRPSIPRPSISLNHRDADGSIRNTFLLTYKVEQNFSFLFRRKLETKPETTTHFETKSWPPVASGGPETRKKSRQRSGARNMSRWCRPGERVRPRPCNILALLPSCTAARACTPGLHRTRYARH